LHRGFRHLYLSPCFLNVEAGETVRMAGKGSTAGETKQGISIGGSAAGSAQVAGSHNMVSPLAVRPPVCRPRCFRLWSQSKLHFHRPGHEGPD
jgi:hypothetical protein